MIGAYPTYTQTVWIEPLDGADLDEVRKLIDEHSDAVTTGATVVPQAADGITQLVYYVEETIHDVERVKKQFRRLNRGKIKFRAGW